MNINLTLIGQMISFGLFIWFCTKFVWPALIAVMVEREEKIKNGLEAAERAAKDLELAKNRAGEQLREAKAEAAALVDAANKRSAQIVDEAKDKARVEGDRILTAARAEIEQEANRAKEELRGKVAALALAGAEKVLGASIDENANSELVSKLAAEL